MAYFYAGTGNTTQSSQREETGGRESRDLRVKQQDFGDTRGGFVAFVAEATGAFDWTAAVSIQGATAVAICSFREVRPLTQIERKTHAHVTRSQTQPYPQPSISGAGDLHGQYFLQHPGKKKTKLPTLGDELQIQHQ